MATLAFFLHHEHHEAVELARAAVAWLTERGHEVRLPKRDAELAGLEAEMCEDDELIHGLDVAVSLGGDGTMLRTVATSFTNWRAQLPRCLPRIHCSSVRHSARLRKQTRMCASTRSVVW